MRRISIPMAAAFAIGCIWGALVSVSVSAQSSDGAPFWEGRVCERHCRDHEWADRLNDAELQMLLQMRDELAPHDPRCECAQYVPAIRVGRAPAGDL